METPGLLRRRIEDAEEQKVVSHHVDVLGTPDHATGRGHVRGSIGARRLQIQGPDTAELQRWKVLCARDAAFHPRGLPANAPAETRFDRGSAGTVGRVFVFFSNRLGCMGSILVSLVGTLFVLLLLGVINLN